MKAYDQIPVSPDDIEQINSIRLVLNMTAIQAAQILAIKQLYNSDVWYLEVGGVRVRNS